MKDIPRPTFEDAVCELCGSPPTDHLMTTRDLAWRKPGEFKIMRCEHCGLVMTTPRPIPADMHLYYEDWYSFSTLEEVRDEQAGCLGNTFTARARLKLLERTGPLEQRAKVLDVGAGFGVQLDYFIRQRGIRATSLDFDPKTCAVSIVRDVAEMRCGDLLETGFEPESFDVVSLYQSLEHVYRPKATLDEAYRILKPGGRLAIDVPDFGAWWRRIWGRYWFGMLVPAHLHHFTKDSLRRVVRAAGFEPLIHESMYWPYEATASLLVAYASLTGAEAMELTRLGRILTQTPYHLPFFITMILWAVLVDFPGQAPLWLLNRTGTQGLVARKSGTPPDKTLGRVF